MKYQINRKVPHMADIRCYFGELGKCDTFFLLECLGKCTLQQDNSLLEIRSATDRPPAPSDSQCAPAGYPRQLLLMSNEGHADDACVYCCKSTRLTRQDRCIYHSGQL